MTARRDWHAEAIASSRARQTICTPRGHHRPEGAIEYLKVGPAGDVRPFRKCADCGTYAPPVERSPID